MGDVVAFTPGPAAGIDATAGSQGGYGVDDDSGYFDLVLGTAPTTGELCSITLGGNYSSGLDGSQFLRPQVFGMNAAAGAVGLFVSNWNSNTITVSCSQVPDPEAGSLQIGYRT